MKDNLKGVRKTRLGKKDKKIVKIPQELRRIMIDTSRMSVKKDSTALLEELRYGAR